MTQCKHKGCSKQALFKSEFCWEHIQDKEKWKKLILRPDKDGKINLREAHLRGANFRGYDLDGADLRGADLDGANLEAVILTKANLERSDLYRANLNLAQLDGANLRGAGLGLATLAYASLGEANLAEAALDSAILSDAKLPGANLRRASLRDTHLIGTNLEGANLEEAYLMRADLVTANLRGANLGRADLMWAILSASTLLGANLIDADLRSANLNEADLTEVTLTGAKVWGMSHAGCKTDGIKAEYLNFDKDGNPSGIRPLNKEQIDEFFSSQPTIEILLQNKLPPYAIRTLLDLIDKINEQNPDWAVEFRKLTSSNFLSELTLKASRDEILEEVANAILDAFKKGYQQKLLEYLPDKKAAGKYDLILKTLEGIENKIENPVERVTIIQSSGKIPININFKDVKMRDIKIFGNVGKMVNVEGNYYEISTPQGREDLIRNLIDQLDSPEIEKRIKEAGAQLKGLSTKQVKFLEEQFRESVEKIFKEKQKEVGFLEKVKAFSQRFSESTFSGVIGNAIWFAIQKFALSGM